MKTYSPTAKELRHEWHLVDADGQILGRLASKVAQVIRGKHKPTFAPHMDGGDFVVVINAEKVRLTGNKAEQKQYFRHTGSRDSPLTRKPPPRWLKRMRTSAPTISWAEKIGPEWTIFWPYATALAQRARRLPTVNLSFGWMSFGLPTSIWGIPGKLAFEKASYGDVG